MHKMPRLEGWVYVLMPNPNVEHQDIASGLSAIFRVIIDRQWLGNVFQGINVSDRVEEWTSNCHPIPVTH